MIDLLIMGLCLVALLFIGAIFIGLYGGTAYIIWISELPIYMKIVGISFTALLGLFTLHNLG